MHFAVFYFKYVLCINRNFNVFRDFDDCGRIEILLTEGGFFDPTVTNPMFKLKAWIYAKLKRFQTWLNRVQT